MGNCYSSSENPTLETNLTNQIQKKKAFAGITEVEESPSGIGGEESL